MHPRPFLQPQLHRGDLSAHPLGQFVTWLQEAADIPVAAPYAMTAAIETLTPAGEQRLAFERAEAPNGLYLIRVVSGGFNAVRRMTVRSSERVRYRCLLSSAGPGP